MRPPTPTAKPEEIRTIAARLAACDIDVRPRPEIEGFTTSLV